MTPSAVLSFRYHPSFRIPSVIPNGVRNPGRRPPTLPRATARFGSLKGILVLQSIALLCSLLIVSPASTDDWPQWRGLNRDGVVSISALPRQWPAALPAPAWRATVGEGYSAPVVAGGKVY